MTRDWKSSESTGPGTGARPDERLHLPNLSIEGFRGVQKLSIPRLGRVTLIAGRNGVGKTTVLDAVRIYASRGRLSALTTLLVNREEITVGADADMTDVSLFDGKALFHGRDTSERPDILIGPLGGDDQLRIGITTLKEEPDSLMKALFEKSMGSGVRVMKVAFGSSVELLPPGPTLFPRELVQMFAESGNEVPSELACESLGPGMPESSDLARLWDRVALTDDEDRVIRAMNLAIKKEAGRVAVVGEGARSGELPNGRRLVVRLKGHSLPVPLKSLGDGAVRLLGVAVALANSREGFLLIDEAENGIHHTLQHDLWRMVLKTAQDNNVQVLATTHSWDCVRGFAQAAVDIDAVEGVLVRLERKGDDRLLAVEYPEDELGIVARDGIEVR